MLQGNVRAAVCWITERTGGGVLGASDSLLLLIILLYILSHKYLLNLYSLVVIRSLPYLEDSDITAAHVQTVACRLQEGAGSGGCNPRHWKDVLLRFGSASGHLREMLYY